MVNDIAYGGNDGDDGDGGSGEMKCINIKTRTKLFGDANSWTFGSCSSDQQYGWFERYVQECCQPAGSYDLVCKSSDGDGWNKGFVQIGDSVKKLCKDFKNGFSKTVGGVEH